MNNCLHKALEMLRPEFKTILEFGVFKGKSTQYLRKNLDKSFQMFGFDSFEGLPEDWTGAKTKERINGVKTGRILDVKKGHFNTDGKIPDIKNVTFYKGWFENTIPDYIKDHKEPIGLIHIDCDLYISTIHVLYALNDYIVPGTLLAFDDWIYNSSSKCNDGEQKAFKEWANFFKREFSFVHYEGDDSRKTQQKLIKIVR